MDFTYVFRERIEGIEHWYILKHVEMCCYVGGIAPVDLDKFQIRLDKPISLYSTGKAIFRRVRVAQAGLDEARDQILLRINEPYKHHAWIPPTAFVRELKLHELVVMFGYEGMPPQGKMNKFTQELATLFPSETLLLANRALFDVLKPMHSVLSMGPVVEESAESAPQFNTAITCSSGASGSLLCVFRDGKLMPCGHVREGVYKSNYNRGSKLHNIVRELKLHELVVMFGYEGMPPQGKMNKFTQQLATIFPSENHMFLANRALFDVHQCIPTSVVRELKLHDLIVMFGYEGMPPQGKMNKFTQELATLFPSETLLLANWALGDVLKPMHSVLSMGPIVEESSESAPQFNTAITCSSGSSGSLLCVFRDGKLMPCGHVREGVYKSNYNRGSKLHNIAAEWLTDHTPASSRVTSMNELFEQQGLK